MEISRWEKGGVGGGGGWEAKGWVMQLFVHKSSAVPSIGDLDGHNLRVSQACE